MDVLEAFEVERVYVSGDPKGTLSYNSFLRSKVEEEYMANGPYTGPLTVISVPKPHTV